MDLSGLIFVALAVVWAVVLIPMALRHHDEAARTRAVDNFSDDLRVVARREAVTARESRLVVAARRRMTSGRTVDRDEVAAAPAVPTGPRDVPLAPEPEAVPAPASVPTLPAMPRQPGPRDVRRVVATHKRAAQAAAKRRRVVLALLLLVTLGVTVGVVTGHLVTWAPAVPGGVVLGFLVLARVMVRREHHAFRAAVARHHAAATETWQHDDVSAREEICDLVLEPAPVAAAPAAGSTSFVSGLDDSQAVPVGLRSEVPAEQCVEGLWDPLPVTLPTYVTKPRAQRSVRTIDLLAPGVQSSGRSAADSALVAEAATAQPVDPGRAVNG